MADDLVLELIDQIAFDADALELDFDPFILEFTGLGGFDGGALILDFASGGELPPEPEDPPIPDPNPAFSRFYTLKTGAIKATDKSIGIALAKKPTLDKTARLLFSHYQSVDKYHGITWSQTYAVDKNISSPVQFLHTLDKQVYLKWSYPPALSAQTRITWDKLHTSDCKSDVQWNKFCLHDISIASLFNPQIAFKDCRKSIVNDHFFHLDNSHEIIWGEVTYTVTCTQVYTPQNGGEVELDFINAKPASLILEFDLDDNPIVCTKPDDSGERNYPNNWPPVIPLVIPKNEILEVYFIMHTISVVVLPGREVIEVSSLSINIDIDSFARSLSMQVIDGIELIMPDNSGNKTIEINVDGHLWTFIIESYTNTADFFNESWTVTGRSRTALLSGPYKSEISDLYPNQILASQIITNELTGSGFALNYSTVNWLVDANAFSYQNLTTMQVVRRVADAIGGVILPHKTNDSLIINPRYQVSPWSWSAALPTAIITHDIIENINASWNPMHDINGIYVTGNNYGVNCFIKRTGTAGEKQGQQFIDDLITHQDAAREKGRNIIADSGNQEVISIQVPVMPLGQTPDLYECGALLEIDQGGNIWRGIVIGTQINVQINNQLITADQTISIEKHYGNYQ